MGGALGARGTLSQAAPMCYVNGRRHALPHGAGDVTLLEFLRERRLTGTKLGCGEGGCGACTVMVSSWDGAAGKPRHRAVNACLAPLYSVEGCHVVTVEGIGNRNAGLHPLQARLAAAHGSQCGFCTPGFVMSAYALMRENAAPQDADVERALAGNLCRCTGYRPIMRAFTELAREAREGKASAKEVSPAGGVCPSTGKPCGCGAKSTASADVADEGAAAARQEEGLVTPAEPIFPPELRRRVAVPLYLPGERATWHRPHELQALLELVRAHPKARIVGGNTEVGVEARFKGVEDPVLIAPTHVPELTKLEETPNGLRVGGAVTLTDLEMLCHEIAAERPAACAAAKAVASQLEWFAGAQIRNVATIAGNICTASPISDLNPILIACGATFTLAKSDGKGAATTREVAAADFFVGYRKTLLEESEVLLAVTLPRSAAEGVGGALDIVHDFKQSHRREDDIAIVTAGVRVLIVPRADGAYLVKEAGVGMGGVAPRTIRCAAVEAALVGRVWGEGALDAALKAVRRDVSLPENVPGGMPEYRMSLSSAVIFKFYAKVSLELPESSVVDFGGRARAELQSAAGSVPRQACTGEPSWAPPIEGTQEVGHERVHVAAEMQVTGEAQYVDDVPYPAGCLFAYPVLSERPHAKLLAVDPTEALAMEGVEGYFGADDVPGNNAIGPVVQDEQCFVAVGTAVPCVGAVIGLVVAESEAAARRGARAVEVQYEELKPVLTIEDAIAAGSYLAGTGEKPHTLVKGNPEGVIAAVECGEGPAGAKVVRGEIKIGGQEHFYLEPMSTVVIPGEGGEMVILQSTQCPNKSQRMVAGVLGCDANRIVCRTKRMGGGFGGKETRAAFLCAAAAVPARHLGRSVRLVLDRDVDMKTTGTRHPFMGRYAVAHDAEGKVLAADVQLWSNGGYSCDLSIPIIDRAAFHSDNCYGVENFRVRATACKTNLPTNTAFRGFGGPQGLIVAETWIAHVAVSAGLAEEVVRERNIYAAGSATPFGQELPADEWNVPAIWSQLKDRAAFAARQAEVDTFNAANRWRKRGLAMVPTKFGISFTTKFMNQGASLVHVYTDGTVLVTHGGTEMGQGLHTKVCQVAAESLGVPLSAVHVADTTTDKIPNASPTAASASSDLYGMATKLACDELMKRLAPYRTDEGRDWLASAAMSAHLDRVDLSEHGFYATPDISGWDWDNPSPKGRPFNYFTQGAAVAEVELDCLTGDAAVRRADVLMDLGRSINPAIDVGQIEGAFVQGLGWCMLEELKWGDSAHAWGRPGHLISVGPGAYKIPAASDAPADFRVHLLQGVENPRAVHSSKAVGEPPFFLAASAWCALRQAAAAARSDAGHSGFFRLDAPATPERVRMVCADAITADVAGPHFVARLSC